MVASPRFADALIVTGPVARAMQGPLRRCYDAMAEPRLVIAVGTCAISGGLHPAATPKRTAWRGCCWWPRTFPGAHLTRGVSSTAFCSPWAERYLEPTRS